MYTRCLSSLPDGRACHRRAVHVCRVADDGLRVAIAGNRGRRDPREERQRAVRLPKFDELYVKLHSLFLCRNINGN